MARILLIEPDRKLACIYATALEADTHHVVSRATAQTAITAADECTPDIVVLELQLTNHSGIEFLYEFRSYSDWLSIPAIVVSHVPETQFAQSNRLLTEQLGVCAYYYKPTLSLAELRRVVAGHAVAI